MPALLLRLPTASEELTTLLVPEEVVAPTLRERIALSPRNLLGLGVILLFALLFAGWLFFSSAPTQVSLGSRPEISSPTPVVDALPAEIVVDVSGKVRHPGVYHLSTGARAQDALIAAGGALPGIDLSSINQAEILVDGTQLLVGITAPASGGGVLSLNHASATELDSLPGVGPVLAGRIVSWRKAHGRFTSIEQLRDVSGVGDAKFADLKSLIRL